MTLDRIKEAVAYIRSRCPLVPEIALVLGSGLSGYVEEIAGAEIIPQSEIPHFPRVDVEGHLGWLVLGNCDDVPVAVLAGRPHYYQGYSMQEVVFPVRVLRWLGARRLIVTNAAGAVNPKLVPGTLMLIEDHINLMGGNPLVGENIAELGPRFPDMSRAYSPRLMHIAEAAARELGFELARGVYAAVVGPSYETPAEIRMLRQLGADAVGMSTVPEVIAANHMGMEVLGISCITNLAAGLAPGRLEHSEVLEATARVRDRFISLLRLVVPRIHGET